MTLLIKKSTRALLAFLLAALVWQLQYSQDWSEPLCDDIMTWWKQWLPMDIHCQDVDILGLCPIRPVDVPHTIVWLHFPCPADTLHVRKTPCTSLGHMLCTFYRHMPGLLHSVCYNVNYVCSTRCATNATGRAPTHQKQIHHVRTLRARGRNFSILLILLGFLPRASGSLNCLKFPK